MAGTAKGLGLIVIVTPPDAVFEQASETWIVPVNVPVAVGVPVSPTVVAEPVADRPGGVFPVTLAEKGGVPPVIAAEVNV